MRSKWLEPMAMVVALLGGASCNAASNASASPEGGAQEAGTDAACGAIPDPYAWAGWVMPNPAETLLPNAARYTVSASGNQVTDEITGLVWQRNGGTPSVAWDEARHSCACATIDGVTGWRLPSRMELSSIADPARVNPSIDVAAFPDTPSESFWSATVLSSDPMLGYLVYFASGFTSYSDLGDTYRTRCVRGGAPPVAPPDRYAIADGAVYDVQTKLTWQQAFPASTYTWSDASAYCSSLSLGGAAWRLPTIGELQTIVDESTNPSIDAAAFPMTPSEYFWSSSVLIDDPTRAWTCFFTNGSTYSFAMTKPKNVRCVR